MVSIPISTNKVKTIANLIYHLYSDNGNKQLEECRQIRRQLEREQQRERDVPASQHDRERDVPASQ